MDLKAQEVAELINGVVEGDNNSTINKLSKIEMEIIILFHFWVILNTMIIYINQLHPL